MSTDSHNLDLSYALVDVFAERPLQGNMLAIFPDARGLSTEHMQALARAMNLPETTFILPAEDSTSEHTHGVRVRIFTTQEELPFAGHPTLGTASWLFWNHPTLRGADTITLALNAGRVPVTFTPPAPGELGVFGSMRQFEPTFGRTHDARTVAEVLGLDPADLDPDHPIETVSTGMPFCIVPFRSLQAIERLAIPQATAQAYLATSDAKFFFCIAPADSASGAHFHNRMQFYSGETPPPVRPPAAPSPTWSVTAWFPVANPPCSNKASKSSALPASTFAPPLPALSRNGTPPHKSGTAGK